MHYDDVFQLALNYDSETAAQEPQPQVAASA